MSSSGFGQLERYFCVITSRTAKSYTQGAREHTVRCETLPDKASIRCSKVHHLCDIARRKWRPPYCYAVHVLAGETLPPTNVHSGSPVADEQGVPPNPLDLHAHCWRNKHLTELTRLKLPL